MRSVSRCARSRGAGEGGRGQRDGGAADCVAGGRPGVGCGPERGRTALGQPGPVGRPRSPGAVEILRPVPAHGAVPERFREIFKRTVTACLEARIATVEVVHIDASLIRANVSWDSLAEPSRWQGRDGERRRSGNRGEAATRSATRPIQEGEPDRSGCEHGDVGLRPAA